MFDDPPEAIDVLLEHGWVEISDFTYMPPSDTPSQLEQDAIQYLVEEWDYGYCPRDAAPIEPFRFVLPSWRAPGLLSAWRSHLDREHVDPSSFASTRQWARTSIRLDPVAPCV